MLLPALQMVAVADAPRAAPTAAECDRAEQRRWVMELLESYVAHEDIRDILRGALVAACRFPSAQLHPSAVGAKQPCFQAVSRCMATPFLEAALHPLSSVTPQSRRETMSTFDRLRCVLPCLPLQCSGPLPPCVRAVLVRRLAASVSGLPRIYPTLYRLCRRLGCLKTLRVSESCWRVNGTQDALNVIQEPGVVALLHALLALMGLQVSSGETQALPSKDVAFDAQLIQGLYTAIQHAMHAEEDSRLRTDVLPTFFAGRHAGVLPLGCCALPGVRGAVWAPHESGIGGEWIHGSEAVWEVRSVGEEAAAHMLGRRVMAPHYPGLKVRFYREPYPYGTYGSTG